jgi:hypothetical protein
MANKKTDGELKIAHIAPGTPEMEHLLAIGYPRIGSVEKAETIIKERKERPELWPYELYEQAQAFLAAYKATPQVISTKPGLKRTRT